MNNKGHNAFPDRGFKPQTILFFETDSLYIDLTEKSSTDSREISEGVYWITTMLEI